MARRSIFLLLVAVSTALTLGQKWRNEALTARDGFVDGFECKYDGNFCKNCEELVKCDMTVSDEPATVKSCTADGEFCSQSLGDCSKKISHCNIETIPTDFKCQHTGQFPDPFDCNIYHVCSESNGAITPSAKRCDTGQSYNPNTLRCERDPAGATCGASDYPIAGLCAGSNIKVGPFKTSPYYYYVCDTANYPGVFRCPEGQIFVPTKFTCVPEQAPPPQTLCKEKGKYAYSNRSCQDYYLCLHKGATPIRKSCPFRMYFHQVKKICHLGICPYV